MTHHVPWDPWPDVRWDALAVVGAFVFEVAEGWAAGEAGSGIGLRRADGAVSIDVRPLSADQAAVSVRRVQDHPDALVLAARRDRTLVAFHESDDVVMLDVRRLRAAQVEITVECSGRDWPACAQVIDAMVDSRWHQLIDEPTGTDSALAEAAGQGPSLPWRASAGVLDHLVRYRDRGLVPGPARRSEAGVAAREFGFVGRFGGVTDKGDEFVGPVLDHDALLAVESKDPAVGDPPMGWACWLQGQTCVVRAGHQDGSESLGIVRAGELASFLLHWLGIGPVDWDGALEPVTITAAQYEDRSGPCPSDVEWFRAAWAAPSWRSVHGWSHQAHAGVGALLVPGMGPLRWERGEDDITLHPIQNAEVVRHVVEAVNAFVAVTASPSVV